MSMWVQRATEFLRSDDGATATEYAIMLSLLIALVGGTLQALGMSLFDVFRSTNEGLGPDGASQSLGLTAELGNDRGY